MSRKATEEFRKKLKDFTKPAACGRSYVLVHSLREYIRDKKFQRCERLINEAFSKRTFDRDRLHGIQRALLVFSILIEIEYEEYIDLFLRHNVFDSNLHSQKKEDIQHCLEKNDVAVAGIIAEQFDKLRWKYCPVEFDLDMGYDLPFDRILPLHRRTLINDKGATANIFKIEIAEEFVQPKLRAKVPHSKSNVPDPSIKQHLYTFAVKTYKTGNKELWRSERSSFEGLEDHERMIRCLGDFEYDFNYPPTDQNGVKQISHQVQRTTYNLILEFGDHDLDDYFKEFLPPVTYQEIFNFYKDLFEIAHEISDLHNLKRERGGKEKEYYGWHADIKPDNILWVKNESFKLADPGFAVFVEKVDGAEAETELKGGTQAYGAPECSITKKFGLVRQTIDTWSLGCVLSVASTWVVLGFQGTLQYQLLRIDARSRAIKKKVAGSRDTFHDEHKALEEIAIWHEYLRSQVRISDKLTSKVLKIIDEEMLLQDPIKRISTLALCEKLDEILREAEAEAVPPPPDVIVQSLQHTDNEASIRPLHEAMEKVVVRIHAMEQGMRRPTSTTSSRLTTGSSKFPLMKTSHRAPGSFFSRTGTSSTERGLRVPTGTTSMEHSLPPDLPIAVTESPPSRQSRQSDASEHLSLSLPRTNSTTISLPPQGVSIQNQIQLKRSEEKKFLSFFHKHKVDKQLKPWLKGRDMIILLDNGNSMTEHWSSAVNIVELIVDRARDFDPNGVDFYVTNFVTDPDVTVNGQKDFAVIKKAMDMAAPKPEYATDMAGQLGALFASIMTNLKVQQRRSIDPRKMTFFILTDGIWSGTENRDAVGDKIVSFVQRAFKILGDLEDRAVSIQFIQFGRDEQATKDLKRLDDELSDEAIPDVVDVEPSDGRYDKMFIGSINPQLDKLETSISNLATSVPSSPPGSQSRQTSPIPGSASESQHTLQPPDLLQTPIQPPDRRLAPASADGKTPPQFIRTRSSRANTEGTRPINYYPSAHDTPSPHDRRRSGNFMDRVAKKLHFH